MTRILLFLGIILLFASCRINKYLNPEDKIFGGATIEFEEGSKFVRPQKVKSELQDLVQADRNSTFGLWAYFALGNPKKERGLRNSLKKRFGEEPEYYSELEMHRSTLLMQKYLKDLGHFKSKVSFDTIQGLNRVDVQFSVRSEGRYQIRKLSLPSDTLRMDDLIASHQEGSLLKPNDFYNVSNLVAERQRIADIANNEGFFDFSEEDIFYFVDTNLIKPDHQKADIWVKLKAPGYGGDFRVYRIGKSYIYPNYDLSRASSIILTDPLPYEDLTILQNTEIIRPRTLSESIVQEEGDLFSKERQRATSNHLLDLGIYKFVNIKYRARQTDSSNFLDRYIYLTPGDVQQVSAEVGGTTRPGFYGLTVKGSYTHKNIFHGAEQLDLSLSTGFENGGRLLVGDDTIKNNLVEYTARAEISIPRFVVPFIKIRKSSSFHIPRTRIGLLANFQRRRRLFTLSSFRASLGYDWEETRHKRHQVRLVSINLVDLSNTTNVFDQYISDNPVLARSFSDQFIMGPSYTYTFTNQEVNARKNYFFFLGQLETSGNLSYLFSNIFGGQSNDPYRIFGIRYSQFSKVDFDLRYNWVRKKSSIVFRFSPGIGIPYLNSEVMPYVKQYYLGGANSLRGFPIRGVLGSFRADAESDIAQSAFDHTGEVKLEFNAEYRFDLFKQFYLKGAFFVDVGNVWLLDPKNLEKDDSKIFRTGKFIDELAVGAGAGLRFDIQYIVVRFDTALPLRKPFLPNGERWTIGQLGNSGWLRNNLVFNIALGYPF